MKKNINIESLRHYLESFDVSLDDVNLHDFNDDINKSFECDTSDLRTFEKLKAVVGEIEAYRMLECLAVKKI